VIELSEQEYFDLVAESEEYEKLINDLLLSEIDYQILLGRLGHVLYKPSQCDWTSWAEKVTRKDPECFVASPFEGQPSQIKI